MNKYRFWVKESRHGSVISLVMKAILCRCAEGTPELEMFVHGSLGKLKGVCKDNV